MNFPYEMGPIRPPSEARSLLIRVTRNCAWNKCTFCPVYKGTKFELRDVEEIKADIKTASEVYGDSYASAFLQDSDSLVMKTDNLVDIIKTIKNYFPRISRITSYSRAKTVSRKKEKEIMRIKEAGLSRLHIGLESGSNKVLEFIKKGANAKTMIDAGLKVKKAGISLCFYIMPGLGGREFSREHAIKTASVLNIVSPDYIRIRSLFIQTGTPLYETKISGKFEEISEIEIMMEIRLLIDRLYKCRSRFVSDHNLNLLLELNGNLPEEKNRLLKKIDAFLSLDDTEKINFITGRRLGIYNTLSDRQNNYLNSRVENYLSDLQAQNTDLDTYLRSVRGMYI